MRLASPSLPVGGFSYSEGIEAAVEAGLVGDEAKRARWLLDQLQPRPRAQRPAARRRMRSRAWRARDAARVAALNAWFATTRETSELRLQSRADGPLAGASGCAMHDDARPAPAPLDALRAGADLAGRLRARRRRHGAPRRATCSLAFAAGWAENMAQAAMKAVPLGQAAGQRMLAGLPAAIPQRGRRGAARLPLDDMQAFTPMLAILSAQHETQYSRLFRS